MNNHKPMCRLNISCAVYHENGICPDRRCDCGADNPIDQSNCLCNGRISNKESTHGKDECHSNLPIDQSNTIGLKEEWNEFIKNTREYCDFPEVLVSHIEDFWFKKLSQSKQHLLEDIKGRIEGMKKELLDLPEHGRPEDNIAIAILQERKSGYNQALQDLLTTIEKEI